MTPPLTPIRSPMPPRSHHRKSNAGGRTTVKNRRSASAAAQNTASSSEKETPTVVFTGNSPFPNTESGGAITTPMGASGRSMTDRSIMTVKRLAATPSRPQPEKLFRSSQNSTSSSPGIKTEQSLAEDDNASSHENDNDEISSDDSDEAKKLQVVSMIQNVLDSGIASISRLRQLFPSKFFKKMDFHGTTITQFDKEAIRKIATMDMDENETYYSEDEEDKTSMVKSFHAKTQKTLSPLTEMSQKHYRSSSDQDRVEFNEKERCMAVEALLVIRWMQQEGVGEILKNGNLACVRFGICVPSIESSESEVATNSDELLESYSFNISCNKPQNPSEVEGTEVRAATGSFFQNLNGFQAGRSLSQSVVPNKTQSFSQTSRANSHYGTQMSSVDYSQSHFSLSQKHHQSDSQAFTMSQKSLMASLSQSIRVSVKKNRGYKIPSSRYLTLRVDFTKALEQNELPLALKQRGRCPTSSFLLASPVAASAVQENGTKGNFVVTPLGRITENGFSGLSVDMTAETLRVADTVENDQDDKKSIHFSQRSRSSAYKRSNKATERMSLSQAEEERAACSSDEDYEEDRHGKPLPFTQPPEKQSSDKDDGDYKGEKEGHLPFTQPHEYESVFETTNSLQKAGTDYADSQTQNARDETDDKENVEFEIGGKAFGLPYGLKCSQQYIMCDVRDHRITKSCLNGLEREEFKVSFHSKELDAVRKKKQWIMRNKLVAYACMSQNIEEALGHYLKEGKGATMSIIFDKVAQEMKVDPGIVQKIAKEKRKTLSEKGNKRVKKSKT